MASQTTQASQANRLAVMNAKGGVGKTTVAINLAGGLDQLGHDTLLIDLDPQGNATEGLGHLKAYDADPPNLFDAIATPHSVVDLIVERDDFDLVPSNVDLLRIERELIIGDLMAKLMAAGVDGDILAEYTDVLQPEAVAGQEHAKNLLDRALSPVTDQYDMVIIDPPPFHGELTDNALFAAPQIVVPALTESTSKGAIELLFDEIAALESETGITIQELAVIANRIERTTNQSAAMLEWLETAFPDVPLFEIPKRVALQYAFDAGETIFEYDPDADVADLYRATAANLARRLTDD